MRSKYFLMLVLINLVPNYVYGSAVSLSKNLQGTVPIKTWKAMRDDQIIHQKLDYSCGAASLATLLKGYYGLNVTEATIIDDVGKDAWLSFADFKRILPKYGLKGIGLALNFDQLKKLKVPAIVYIDTRAGPHFAVLRGINNEIVWLGDPATGNEHYPVYRFIKKWEVRDDPVYKGKIFVVLPEKGVETQIVDGFFGDPTQDTSLPLKGISLRRQLISY